MKEKIELRTALQILNFFGIEYKLDDKAQTLEVYPLDEVTECFIINGMLCSSEKGRIIRLIQEHKKDIKRLQNELKELEKSVDL